MSAFRGIALTVVAAHLLGCGDGGRSLGLPPGPTVLATGTELSDQWPVERLVSDGRHVYWSEGAAAGAGNIHRVAVTGGAPEILASGQSLPSGIDLDDTSVYWVEACCDNQHVRKLSKAGGTPVDLAAIPAESYSFGLSVRGGWVYVAVSPWSAATVRGILRVPTEGGAATWLTETPCDDVAVNDAAVYCRPLSSSAFELALAGGTPSAWTAESVQALAATGTRVFWTNTLGLMTANSGALDTPTSIGSIANAWQMALGREHVFVTSYDRTPESTGSIIAFPMTGTALPVTLAEGLRPVLLTADADSVFWVSEGKLTRLSY